MRDIKPKKSEDTQNERNALNGHGEFTRICRCLALSEETTQTAWRMHEAVRKRCCLMVGPVMIRFQICNISSFAG
jgi:hypothetical protein